MIERLDVTHLLKSSNKQYWFGRLDNLGKYLDRIAAYFSGSVRWHRFAALVTRPISVLLVLFLIIFKILLNYTKSLML